MKKALELTARKIKIFREIIEGTKTSGDFARGLRIEGALLHLEFFYVDLMRNWEVGDEEYEKFQKENKPSSKSSSFSIREMSCKYWNGKQCTYENYCTFRLFITQVSTVLPICTLDQAFQAIFNKISQQEIIKE